jgi:hypothetical protein
MWLLYRPFRRVLWEVGIGDSIFEIREWRTESREQGVEIGLALGAQVFAQQAVGQGQVPDAAAQLFGFALVLSAHFGVS